MAPPEKSKISPARKLSATDRGKFSNSNNGRGLLRNSLKIARVGAIKNYKPRDRATIPAHNRPERTLHVPTPAAK